MDAPTSSGVEAVDEAAEAGRLRRRRVVRLFLGISVLVLSYAVLFVDLYNRPRAVEKVFVTTTEGKWPLDIYFEVLSMDPVRQAIQARLDFATKAEIDGPQFGARSGSDGIVHVSDGYDVQDVALQAGVRSPSKSLELEVSGQIENYPVDRYEGKLLIGAFQGSASADGAMMPIRLTAWEELNGWYLPHRLIIQRPTDADSPSTSACIAPTPRFFLIGVSALMIAGLAFVGTRKIETTLIAALGAMVFAVPALRNIMPGAPPLGVRADAFVFLWVQLTVIVGLTIVVATWAHRGPGP